MIITGRDDTPVRYVQQKLKELVPNAINPRLMNATTFYWRFAPSRDLKWTWCLCQAIHETDYMRSDVCVNLENYAGVKAPPSGEYRAYANAEAGIADHLDLLAVYTGMWVPNMPDPSRNVRIPDIIQKKIGRPAVIDSTELNGIWAVPGDQYAQNIERLWDKLIWK